MDEKEGKIELETLRQLSVDINSEDDDDDNNKQNTPDPEELHQLPELTTSKLPPLSLSKILYRLSCDKCSFSRIGVLLPFLVFNVGLIFFDVASDMQTGLDLLSMGHHYWGGGTLALQFLPFVGFTLVSLIGKWRGLKDVGFASIFWQSLNHLPFVQPITNSVLFLKLLEINTDCTKSYHLTEYIQTKSSHLGFYEAFLEAGPQFVLQLGIILRLGYFTLTQAISVPFSLASLTYSATKTYYLQRMSTFADPNPPLAKNVLLLFPVFAFVTFSFVAAWAILFAYLKHLTLVIVLIGVFANTFLIFFFRIGRNVAPNPRWLPTNEDGKSSPEDYAKASGLYAEMSELKRKAAFTALLTPCIVGHHDTNLLFISSLSTTMGFFIWLLLLPSMSSVSFDGFTDADNPPITYCLKTSQESLIGQVCLLGKNASIVGCGASLVRYCQLDECLPSLRFCAIDEETNDMLMKVVNPIICGLLVASLLITMLIQWLSNFLNLYKITKFLTRGQGYMHRSLICSLVESGNHKMLERLFQNASDVKEMICRPNRYGDTPLHISCRQKDEVSTRLLLQKKAKPSVQNAQGQTPVHLAVMAGQNLSTEIINMAYPAYVDCKDNTGRTAMDHAIERNMVECVNALLINKFRLNHKLYEDEKGKQSLAYMSSAKNNILHKACYINDKEVIKKISETAQGMSDSNGNMYARLKFMLMEKDLDGKNPMEIAATSMEWEVFYYIIMIMHSIRGQAKTKFWLSFDLDISALLESAISNSRYRGCLLLDYLSWQDLLTKEDLESYLEYFQKLLDDREAKWTLLEYAVDYCSPEAVAAILPFQDSEFVGNLYETEDILYRACNFVLAAGPFDQRMSNFLSDPSNTNKKLEVLLNYASGHNYEDGIQGFRLDINVNYNDQSLLHHSVKHGKEELTKFLLEKGANVNAVDDSGTCTPLHLAASSGNLEILEILLDAGANPDAWHIEIRDFISEQDVINRAFRHEWGNKALPLHAAIVSGNDPQGHCVKRLLEACPDHSSARTKWNGFHHHTPLILASLCTTADGKAQIGIINTILKYEQDYLELHNFIYEETALCAAIRVGNVEAVKRLLEVGANVEHKVRSIPTAYNDARENKGEERELTPLALTLALRYEHGNTWFKVAALLVLKRAKQDMLDEFEREWMRTVVSRHVKKILTEQVHEID